MSGRRPGASAPPLRSRTVPLPAAADPFALAGEDGFAWSSPAAELVTSGVAARVRVGRGRSRLERAARAVATLLERVEVGDPEGSGLLPLAVGALPFDDRTGGELVVPALVARRGPGGALWVTVTGAGDLPDPAAWPAPPASLWPAVTAVDGGGREAWRAMVTAALDGIAGGRLDKVVLAREVRVRAGGPFPRAALLRRLRERAPGCFVFGAGAFVGASPELLVARDGARALARPMAGTVGRGATPAAEERALAWLRSSAKEAVEHRLVADAVATALAKVADEVTVTGPEVVRLATLSHLATRVAAVLGPPLPSALELAALLHPTPAVAGTPPEAAGEVIAALEPFRRGPYAGPVGWVDAAGDGEWAVALRCATLDRAGARLVAGAGIVAGSDPDAEWAETEHKLAAMLNVLQAR